MGVGTQRLDEELSTLFPDEKIIRIDRDATRRKNSLQTMLQEIHDNKAAILVGTQMLTKGHHFPNLTLVAVVDADAGLFSVDFRAQERLAQLLLQVAGRAGRGEEAGTVLLQTHHPDHPLLQTLFSQGYAKFAQAALEERALAALPPYRHMALLHAEAKTPARAEQFLQQISNQWREVSDSSVQIFGPVPAIMARRRGFFRAQLLFKSADRIHLQKVLTPLTRQLLQNKLARQVRWSLDVDPLELG